MIDTRNAECNMLRQIRWPNPTTVPLQRPGMAGRIVLSDNFVSRIMHLLSMYLFGNSETVHLEILTTAPHISRRNVM